MADRQKISQLILQIAYDDAPIQKISQLILQVAFDRGDIFSEKCDISQSVTSPTITKIVSAIASSISQSVSSIGAMESAGPSQDQVMRHGCWFGSGVKQPFWWAR